MKTSLNVPTAKQLDLYVISLDLDSTNSWANQEIIFRIISEFYAWQNYCGYETEITEKTLNDRNIFWRSFCTELLKNIK